MSAQQLDPFARLGLCPTLEVAAIKRAYFACVAVCPPHRQGEEFRALRAAYEELSRPEQRTRAFLRAGPTAAEAAELRARYGPALDAARARAAQDGDRRERIERFVATFSRLTLAEALQSAGRDP